jgi:hypothetical protein
VVAAVQLMRLPWASRCVCAPLCAFIERHYHQPFLVPT